MASPLQSEAPFTDKLTYADYLELPDDGKRYGILDGELAVTASPLLRHQHVSRNLEFILHAYVRANDLGEVLDAPVTVVLDDTTVVVPDLIYVSRRRAAILSERAIAGPPDLLIEILSDSTEHRDRGAKSKLYAPFGVDHYWIVDPTDRTVDVFERHGRSYRAMDLLRHDGKLTSPLFPGLVIDLAEVWA